MFLSGQPIIIILAVSFFATPLRILLGATRDCALLSCARSSVLQGKYWERSDFRACEMSIQPFQDLTNRVHSSVIFGSAF